MLKEFKGVSEFYGNGTVYVTDGSRFQRYREFNFEVGSVKRKGDDYWLLNEVVVALGAGCQPADAITKLERILSCLRHEVHRKGFREYYG